MTDTYTFLRAVENLQTFLDDPDACLETEDLRYVLNQINGFLEAQKDTLRLDYLDELVKTRWDVDDWRRFGESDRRGVRFGTGFEELMYDETTPFGADLREAIDNARVYLKAKNDEPRE